VCTKVGLLEEQWGSQVDNWMQQSGAQPQGAHSFLSARSSDIALVASALSDVGRTLGRPVSSAEAQWPVPLVPEASDFLRALSQARREQSASLHGLSVFFHDANTSLSQFIQSLDTHEQSTAAGWNRW